MHSDSHTAANRLTFNAYSLRQFFFVDNQNKLYYRDVLKLEYELIVLRLRVLSGLTCDRYLRNKYSQMALAR